MPSSFIPHPSPLPPLQPEEAYLYGTSIATVREVAATGKLCIMGLDEQGVRQLQVGQGGPGCIQLQFKSCPSGRLNVPVHCS